MGVYCARNKSNLDHPRVETISELVKRTRGMAVGVVTNTEIEDATPAAMVAHNRLRADYNNIVKDFFAVQPEVIMGGGTPNFLAKSAPGSKRIDEDDYIQKFRDAGYAYVTTNTELTAAKGANRLLGLFNPSNIDGALDRFFLKKGTVSKFPDQPDLTDQVRAALDVLSKNDKGFVLMVESGRIDKYSHSLDWERAVYDTIMLDNAVKVAKDFAADRDDTLIVVVADHAHGVAIVGTYDDEKSGPMRSRLGTYNLSQFPNYPAPNADGYPDKVDVSKRLAFVFSTYPDFCDTGRPYLDGENVPAVEGETKGTYVANEKNCAARRDPPRRQPPVQRQRRRACGRRRGADRDGPGAEQFRGRIDNTRVFRYIATALGLSPGPSRVVIRNAPKRSSVNVGVGAPIERIDVWMDSGRARYAAPRNRTPRPGRAEPHGPLRQTPRRDCARLPWPDRARCRPGRAARRGRVPPMRDGRNADAHRRRDRVPADLGGGVGKHHADAFGQRKRGRLAFFRQQDGEFLAAEAAAQDRSRRGSGAAMRRKPCSTRSPIAWP